MERPALSADEGPQDPRSYTEALLKSDRNEEKRHLIRCLEESIKGARSFILKRCKENQEFTKTNPWWGIEQDEFDRYPDGIPVQDRRFVQVETWVDPREPAG